MKWGKFIIGEIFNVSLPSGDTQADKCEDGDFPLLSAGTSDNGICKFIKNGDDKSKLNNGNIISVDMFGKAFCHLYKFYSVSHGRINILTPNTRMNEYYLKFIITAINNCVKGKFSYNQMCSSKRVRDLIIQLPINESGEPDYLFMEKFIRSHESKLIREYLHFISAKVHAHPPTKLLNFASKQCASFFISEIAEILSGRDIYEDERVSGLTPYIGSSAINNGITHFVDNTNETKESKCISVNRNGSVGFAFYHPYEALYSNDCRKLRLVLGN